VAAARAGARVLLAEEEHQLGGHLRWADPAALDVLLAQLRGCEGIEVLTDSAVLARYDQNWIAVVQRGLPGARERLIKARASSLIVAGGLLERPYVFAGNDLPGVMLSTAVRRLINLYAVKPGERAVVLTANAEGDAAVADLERAGVEVAHVADARRGADVLRARGPGRVRSVELADGRRIRADLLVTATGWTAPTSLLNMAGDVPVYEPRAARFLPGAGPGTGAGPPNGTGSPNSVFAVGGIAGDGTLEELLAQATAVGTVAAERGATIRSVYKGAVPTRDGRAPAPPQPSRTPVSETSVPELGVDEHPELFRGATHGIVDFSEDVSSKDLHQAAGEGYDSAELAKRYTTATMGPLQGKLEAVNAIAVIAEATGRTIAETGTTTWRPMYVPVTLGALAGRTFEPVRYSPMQSWHERHGARPLVAGQWIRPDHYGDPAAEVRAVREGVAIIDVTPIGKLDLRGPDVPRLLNQLYVNKWSKLAIGSVRYGAMCAEDGVVFDDGVTGRLGADHYLMSTTSSGAAAVWQWVESWLQTEHPEWRVHVTPVTTAYASINVAGPRSRELVGRLADGVDLSGEAFGYMRVRTGRLAGVDDCVLWRIGFTGELSYELHVPASYGLHVWTELLAQGADLGVRPFGVEAQRILRLEKGHLIVGQDTDGLTRAYSAGLDWAVKLDKDDFAGKPELAAQRERGDGARLVGIQPDDGQVVPPEASQIITGGGQIAGRITSSRMSPTLGRSICLGQVDAALAGIAGPGGIAEPGSTLTVRLPDGRDVTATVTPTLAHVDPDGERQRAGSPAPGSPRSPAVPVASAVPVARSAIAAGERVTTALAGWEVDATRSAAAFTIADYTPLAKIAVRGREDGPLAAALRVRFGVGFGRSATDAGGNLVIGSGPGEWLILGNPGSQDKLLPRIRALADEALADQVPADQVPAGQAGAGQAGEFGSVIDLTHGRAMVRLTGADCVALLGRVCGIDLSDDVTPDGAAFRTSVASLVTDVVRADSGDRPSYLLHCERSSGQYLFDTLLDVGAEFGLQVDGCPAAPPF
ncbi:MAG: hypothetical protein J2P25_24470, partial [Nocardiopsaceae bacterium]|nr:hypothetical protein [Nocardiopsaceae bacterium]